MTRYRLAVLVVLTALLAAGCSVEYKPVVREGGEGLPEVGGDASPEAPDTAEPGLSLRSEAEGATPAEEPLESGRAPAVAPASVPPESPPRVKPRPAAVEPRPTPPAAVPSAGYERPLIRLSTGVALAQSLPIGTTMGFSVEYEFTSGEPGSSPYVWVIEASKGETKRQAVQLQARGTLQGFFPPLRPENGPFSTHIEDGQGNRLSKSLPLR